MADTESETESYPGETASPWQILDLASRYEQAFIALSVAYADMYADGPGHHFPESLAPARFCAIHAIELYLNAVLRFDRVPPAYIRGRMHALDDPHFLRVLGLRKKTALHLGQLTARREYLVSRYDARQMHLVSEVNRITATLAEVAQKASAHLNTTPYLEWRANGLE